MRFTPHRLISIIFFISLSLVLAGKQINYPTSQNQVTRIGTETISETAAGYTVLTGENEQGIPTNYYATLNDHGNLVPSQYPVGSIDPETVGIHQHLRGPGLHSEPPVPSGGSYMLNEMMPPDELSPIIDNANPVSHFNDRTVTTSFNSFNYDDNATYNSGYSFIPPDPIGAAGTSSLVAVGNALIEMRDKTGTLIWIDDLAGFFTTLTPVNSLFDPKVVFDHYENRFVVVALEKVDAGTNPNGGNTSRILVAVSNDAYPETAASPNWYYTAINSEESIGGFDHWADYPGFEVDEEAVYITANMFAHPGGTTTASSRCWIIDKGVSSGFYSGGAASISISLDPYALTGISSLTATTMPALVFGAGGVGTGIGTFLISYGGLSSGGSGGVEWLIVFKITNPISSPSFSYVYVNIDDIEDVGGVYGWPALADAPQSGGTADIEVNNRRLLDAVWRNNYLWVTTTIDPNSGSQSGQTTAHWIKLNADGIATPTLADQGDIGADDLGTSTYTFFPSVAVNSVNDAYFGFAASNASIYCGAYCAGRASTDGAGTVRSTETVAAGTDYYLRTFYATPPRNRWGDYSGASLDPVDESFWIFNQYAMTQNTSGEFGRWATAWARLSDTYLSNDELAEVPESFTLSPAYPNPFNPVTTIQYSLPVLAEVKLAVYDINGRKLVELLNQRVSPGEHQISWDAGNYASGVYFVKLIAGSYSESQKIMLIK